MIICILAKHVRTFTEVPTGLTLIILPKPSQQLDVDIFN